MNSLPGSSTPASLVSLKHPLFGLRTVAVFEAAKGALVLLAGFGVLALVNQNTQQVADQIVRHFHLNPASRYPRIFLQLAGEATPLRLWLLAAGALFYALVRFLEAYGLWCERRWAEWLAVVSSGIYLPIEIWELTKGLTWLRVTLPVVNLVIVLYLARTLARTRSRKHAAGRPRAKPELFLVLGGCAAWLTLLGWIDFATGYELGLFAFYSAPVVLAAWYLGRGPAIGVAFFASLVWFLADRLAGDRYSSPFFGYWNTGMHFATFLINAVTFAKIKSNWDQRHELERALREAHEQIRQKGGQLLLCPHCAKPYAPEPLVAGSKSSETATGKKISRPISQ